MKFWLIAIPSHPNPNHAWSALYSTIGDYPYAYTDMKQLRLPDFTIGTLDALILAAEALQKHDAALESTVYKMMDTLHGLLKDAGLDSDDAPLALPPINNRSFVDVVMDFEWNVSKYRSDRPIREIGQAIGAEVGQVEHATRVRMNQYQQLKGQLHAMERKNVGNLSVRALTDVIQRHHVVLDSEYLNTLFVAVPKSLEDSWWASYESLVPMVVPRSSETITQDAEYLLVNVTVFKKTTPEFITRCREERFIVRDFTFEEGKSDQDVRAMAEYSSSRDLSRTQLMEWTRTNLADVCGAWVHIKMLRLFAESVLRYGLPPEFVYAVAHVKPKTEDKAKARMEQRYAYLGREFEPLADEVDKEEYRPYVWFPLEYGK
jgi:V-type H+-transporting ATPase subunit C